MLSRRDYQKRLRKMEQKNEHFSIRKLSVGAASVLIGLSFLGFNTHSAQAAEKTDTNTATKNKAGSITDNTKTFTVGNATEASSKPNVVISTDKDGNVHMSTTGTPLVQENAPAYNGGVADSDPTSYALPEASIPKGESSVGDATEASSNPNVVISTDKDGNVHMSTTGTPLVQENKPAYNGGVADSDPTSYSLPEASIPSSSASSSASSEASVSSAASSASSEASVSSASNSVATTNTASDAVSQVSTPVASRADVHNGMLNTVNHGVVATNQNQSKALPQTGAKTNMAGMLGLMIASVGAILGFAVTKKHEN